MDPRAKAALERTFGRVPPLTPILGGASAQIFRVDTDDGPFVLRVDRARDAFRDPDRAHACMRAAAEAGLAPPVRHAEDGVAIMDFVATQPLASFPGGPTALCRELGRLVARLQATPTFPALGESFPVLLEQMLRYVAGSGLFVPGLLAPHVDALAGLSARYPWGPTVSSHNDPNPRNVLFDGTRLWLVDWETAFRNDPYADVAMLVENFATTPDQRDAVLEGWLGRPAASAERAQLAAMLPLARLYYACILLAGLAAGGARGEPDATLDAMPREAIHAAAASGAMSMPAVLYALGKMFLATFLEGAR